MKLLNKLKVTLLIAFFMIIMFNLKSYAVTGIITEITVNMRKEPSTSSKKIMYVTQDYKVEVLEKVGDWYKIKYNGVTGYVFGQYVDVDDSKLEVKEENQTVPEEIEKEQQDTVKEETEKKEETTENNIQDVTTDVPAELQIKDKTVVKLIPNITSASIYTAKKAISVDVVEQIGNWSYVYVDGIWGWVRTENIIEKNSIKSDTENKEEEKVEISEKTVAYIKYDTVNLRKKASTTSTVLAKLKLNNEVIVLEKVNSKWSKVEYDGLTGYVSSDLLSSEKQEEKEEKDTTSRDGEVVSREEEEEKQKEETKVEETKKEETKKEESSNTVNNKEEIKENEKTESKNDSEEKQEETSEKVEEEDKTKEETKVEENKKEDNETDKKSETSSKTKGEEIAAYAKKYVGYKYVYGGTSPKTGFDCSGLTYYVYKQFGYTLSRTSKAQAKNGKEVNKNELQPGDLLIFKNQSLTAIGHVGIYIGNNKMVHASEPGIGVVITDLNANGYNYNKRYVTARRIVE